MKLERFTAGQLWIEHNRRREGPPVVYTAMIGKTAMLFTDTKALVRFAKWPKSTPTGDALREWLASFEQEKKAPAPETDFAERIKFQSFGPEAYTDDEAYDPILGDDVTGENKMQNTRMVFERFLKS